MMNRYASETESWAILRISGLVVLAVFATKPVRAAEPEKLTPKPATQLEANRQENGWRFWSGIAHPNGAISYRERLTAMVRRGGELWIATSYGRILSFDGKSWTLQGTLPRLQVTSFAFESPLKIWLSTSDGIARLEKQETGDWEVRRYRTYYEGHPAFVSGAYLPGEDAVRTWGFVDNIYLPPSEKSYGPFAISVEHGLFSWGGYGGVWHHYLPHYSGANSAWLDIRDLLPHRRPTCMLEDREGNLWTGSQWDGLLRFNAHGRKYSERDSDDNEADGTEFTYFRPPEVGVAFDQVVDLTPASDGGIWAALKSRNGPDAIAHFDGKSWTTRKLPEEISVYCLAEQKESRLLLGGRKKRSPWGLMTLDWTTGETERWGTIETPVRRIAVFDEDHIFAASWWGLYEYIPKQDSDNDKPAPTAGSPPQVRTKAKVAR